MEETIGMWEGEGGAIRSMPVSAERSLISTPNQVEWALQIRARVNAEFDRVAKALRSAAKKRPEHRRANIQVTILILEDKRAEVMAKAEAGYFIHDWQELGDQVRRMIAQDSRYRTIKAPQVVRQ